MMNDGENYERKEKENSRPLCCCCSDVCGDLFIHVPKGKLLPFTSVCTEEFSTILRSWRERSSTTSERERGREMKNEKSF